MRLVTLVPYAIVTLCLYGALQQRPFLFFPILIVGSVFLAPGGRQRVDKTLSWMKPLIEHILGFYPRDFPQKPEVSPQNFTVLSTQEEMLHRYKEASDNYDLHLCAFRELHECCSNKIMSICANHRASLPEVNVAPIQPDHSLEELLSVGGLVVQSPESHRQITVNADVKRNQDHLEHLCHQIDQLSGCMLKCIESSDDMAFERHYQAYQETVKELKLKRCDILWHIHDFFQVQCPDNGLIHDIVAFIDITNCVESPSMRRCSGV